MSMKVPLEDNAQTSTVGQVLKVILTEINSVKTQDVRINDIEKSMTIMSSAVEQLNSNTAKLIETVDKFESKTIEVQMKTSEIMMELKNAIIQFSKIENRVDRIEDTQLHSCPSLNALKEKIEVQVEQFKSKSESLQKGVDKTREELSKYVEDEHKWKEGLMLKLIGSGLLLLGTLVMTIFNMVKH